MLVVEKVASVRYDLLISDERSALGRAIAPNATKELRAPDPARRASSNLVDR